MEIWEPFKKVIKHWKSLSKSQRPENKSYECLQRHYTDLIVLAKFQFFAFVTGIFEPYLVMFQTDWPMVPFMFPKLEKIFDKLHWLIFRQESNNTAYYLESGLVDVGAAIKALLNNAMVSTEKERKF